MLMMNRWFRVVACTAGLCSSLLADTNAISADWGSRTGVCPANLKQSATYTIQLTNVNDILFDFKSGKQVIYNIKVASTLAAKPPDHNPFSGQIGSLKTAETCTVNAQAFQDQLDALRSDLINHHRDSITPNPDAYVPLADSLSQAQNIPAVSAIEDLLTNTHCDFASSYANDMVVVWIKRVYSSSHTASMPVNLEPGYIYKFTIRESWLDKDTGQEMSWTCGEPDIFSLSLGPLVSTLPARTYNSQSAPVSPGSSTAQNVLVVGNNSNLNVLGAALVNYHFPDIPGFPLWLGFALSAGPVYQLGNSSPSVSSLGIFVGGSVHLSRSFFLTAGTHIGQFADFPAGFHPGQVIPSDFGTLTPVKRESARFAVGITFRTTSFKKSNQNTGTTNNGNGGNPASGNTKTTLGTKPNQ
jgi:hypothetical protein